MLLESASTLKCPPCRYLACGLSGVPSQFQSRFAGIRLDAYSGAYTGACGLCIEAICSDPAACPGGRRPVVLQVLDDCRHCGPGDLNLEPSVFE